MWQRIQTVFLIIAIINLIVSLFFPIWILDNSPGSSYALFPMHYTVTENGTGNTISFPYTVTAILIIAATTIAIIEIRKFKNRVLQMKLGALNSLFMAGAIASAVIFSHELVKTYPGGHYSYAMRLPGVAVICNLVSNAFIRRDERLVRDSDRLR